MPSFATEGRPIFVVGFMATGKTTVGQLLAARLGRPFVDLDARLVGAEHATIAEQFAAGGEAAFRRREAAALCQAAAEGAVVVAVGGGAPAWGDNLERMRGAGVVVCLTAAVDDLLARLGGALERPLLAEVADKRAEVERLLAVRAPFYAQAHVTVDTSGRAPSQVVTAILGALGGAA
jgi:shikimate kinase